MRFTLKNAQEALGRKLQKPWMIWSTFQVERLYYCNLYSYNTFVDGDTDSWLADRSFTSSIIDRSLNEWPDHLTDRPSGNLAESINGPINQHVDQHLNQWIRQRKVHTNQVLCNWLPYLPGYKYIMFLWSTNSLLEIWNFSYHPYCKMFVLIFWSHSSSKNVKICRWPKQVA